MLTYNWEAGEGGQSTYNHATPNMSLTILLFS